MLSKYANKHTGCPDFAEKGDLNFTIYGLQEDTDISDLNHRGSILLYIQEGSMEVTASAASSYVLETGSMSFVPSGVPFKGHCLSDCKAVTCLFSIGLFLCEKASDTLKDGPVLYGEPGTSRALKAKPMIASFFRMLEDGLCAGLGSACFHDIKRKELLLMMWNMYTRDELFMLLQPAIEQRSSFKDFVYRNYRNILDVKTFAVKANMSVSTFQRWFKLEFGQLPGEWLKERRAEIVLREIITTDKPFSVIAEEFGFSSGSHLGTFCKQHFGQLPSRLRPKNSRV